MGPMQRIAVLAIVCVALGTSSYAQVVINEIQYNPAASAPASNAEFLELYNAGPASVSVAGWSIADAVTITIPAGTTIPSHTYLVLAKDSTQVTVPGGIQVIQWTSGSLSDGGEIITLRDASTATVDVVNYDDAAPWTTVPDGSGKSLELLNPALDNSQAASWGASTNVAGTPGAQNSIFSNSPTIASESPARRTAVASLPSVSVTFSASVTGVTAGGLTVGGSPATSVSCPSCVG